ncbi:hypothetical protein Q7P36_008855 [Cladosporium allicinum]
MLTRLLLWRTLAKLDGKLDLRVRKEEVESTELYVANDASCNDPKYLYFRIIEVSKPEAGSGADDHDLHDKFPLEILFHTVDGLINLEEYRWSKIASSHPMPPMLDPTAFASNLAILVLTSTSSSSARTPQIGEEVLSLVSFLWSVDRHYQ